MPPNFPIVGLQSYGIIKLRLLTPILGLQFLEVYGRTWLINPFRLVDPLFEPFDPYLAYDPYSSLLAPYSA